MRITRGNGPPRRLVHLFRAPVPNPFVNALGSREDFQRDLAAGALGEIPFFCDFCHGFWWPEYHPYAEARLGVDVIFSPIVQSHVCEECGGVWGREAIFQSMPPVWHFAGRQRMERYHWVFLGAEIEYHSRYPGWLTARQYTPPSAQRPGVQWPFRDLPFRVFPDDGWQILRVPEDDDDFLPPLPDQNLGAGVNQVIVVSDPRDVGEPSPGFERAQRDFFCEGPTLDWESDSEESSDESSRGPGDYGVWESDWESEGEDSDPQPPFLRLIRMRRPLLATISSFAKAKAVAQKPHAPEMSRVQMRVRAKGKEKSFCSKCLRVGCPPLIILNQN